MRQAICHLRSTSPYSQSKYIPEQKRRDELYADFEERVWRQRIHRNSEGMMIIPPIQLKRSLDAAASYKTIKIPGQGQRTFTKHFHSGIMVNEPIVLPYRVEEVPGDWVMSGGQGSGSTTIVAKCFPLIEKWEGIVTYTLLDDILTQDVFEEVLRTAGLFIGIGSYRPSASAHGHYGRYRAESIEWHTIDLEAL